MDILFEAKEVKYYERATKAPQAQITPEETLDDFFGDEFIQTQLNSGDSLRPLLTACTKDEHKAAMKDNRDCRVETNLQQIIIDGSKVKFKFGYHSREHGFFKIKKKIISEKGQKYYEWKPNTHNYCSKRVNRIETISLDLKSNNVYVTTVAYNDRRLMRHTRTNEFKKLLDTKSIMTFYMNKVKTVRLGEHNFNFFDFYKRVFEISDISENGSAFAYLIKTLFDGDLFGEVGLNEFVMIWYMLRNHISIGHLTISGRELGYSKLLEKRVLGDDRFIDGILSKRFNIDLMTLYYLTSELSKPTYISHERMVLFDALALYSITRDIPLTLSILTCDQSDGNKKIYKSKRFEALFGYSDLNDYRSPHMLNMMWPENIKLDLSEYYINTDSGLVFNDTQFFQTLNKFNQFTLPRFVEGVRKFESFFGKKIIGTFTLRELFKVYVLLYTTLNETGSMYLNLGPIDKSKIKFVHKKNQYEIKPIIKCNDYDNILNVDNYIALEHNVRHYRFVVGVFINRKLDSIIYSHLSTNKRRGKVYVTTFSKDKGPVTRFYKDDLFDKKLISKISPILKYYRGIYKDINYGINLSMPNYKNNELLNKLLN